MYRYQGFFLALAPDLFAPQSETGDMTVAEDIDCATGAAPATLSAVTAELDWSVGEGQDFVGSRRGNNDWTCFPAMPGNDPMGVDETWRSGVAACSKPTVTPTMPPATARPAEPAQAAGSG